MAWVGALLGGSFDRGERTRLTAFFGGVGLLHIAGWGLLLTVAAQHPAFLALGGLAYTFGLRHAFDADHISAIDNTTRKLLQDGRRPVGVGFFFSLGHSTVVFLIAAALGLTVKWVLEGVVGSGGQLRSIGTVLGSGISGAFLVLIGILNLLILLDILRVYGRMKAGGYDSGSLDHDLTAGGFMTRIFGRLFRIIAHSWQMYPIGFLFGLGFDTASEVAILAISAGAAANGVPIVAVIALPLIFAAGMSLMDTADGAFMVKAYSWAFASPMRKVFYNLTMTSLSVFVALFVGVVELMQVLVQALNLRGGVFGAIATFDLVGRAGYFIVAAFILAWAAALMIYKARRIDERWADAMDQVA
jgi:nickel/cobalt transporter (NiCoT) family protein